MAVTNQELFNIFLANPNMSDAQIVSLMETRGISPEQISSTFGIPVGEVVSRVAATVPEGMSVTLGDTRIAPQYEVRGSGEDRQVVGIENITVEKTTGDINYKPPVGAEFQNYSPTGEFIGTGKVTSSGDQSFFGGLVDALKDPVVLAALGGAYAGGLFGGTGALGGATAATVGTTGLTAAELAAYDLALGGVGGSTGATQLASALTTGATIPTVTSLTGGSGVGTLGVTGANGAFLGEGVLSGVPASDLALANAPTAFELANAGASAFTPTVLTPANTGGLLTTPVAPPVVAPPVVAPPVVAPPVVAPPVVAPPVVAPPVVAPPVVAPPVIAPPTVADITKLAQTGLTAAQIAALLQTGTQTAAGLLQQQTSREAAQKAQAMIDAETAAAKTAAQFRPIGMTTRFGTSQFKVDPVTGQLTSAGYTLSPEAKAAQDQFAKLAEYGITQAKEAQGQFAPLQTGAQRLFELGQGYLAKTPQDVAQNYLNQQMALLQPGRELELANLQNRLQQQGRGGLSVAQGGTMGATTPELQALFNARAQQEAQLAANAQQFGQQQVTFGAGLLGQGSQAMGQYYGGQQAAYAPYTTALGQIQALESAAQQPFQMGVGLGQQASAAGARVGALGLEGANISQRLATGADATRNPYASALSGLAASPAFAGLFSGVPSVTAMSAPATTFGTGNYYGQQDLGLYL